MSQCRPTPCEACPYRQDVPSGVWAHHEYEKLRQYDQPTGAQPFAVFACHANPEFLCNGWVLVHESRGHENELLALRMWPMEGPMPRAIVPLFESGNDAADHGQRDLEAPQLDAVQIQERLLRRHPRLEVDK